MSTLSLNKPTLPKGITCQELIDVFKDTKVQQFLVTNDETHVTGIVTSSALFSSMISGVTKQTDHAEKVMIKQFTKVATSTTLGKLSRILETEPFVIVLNNDNTLFGIIKQSDIFNFITKSDNISQNNGII